MRDICGMKRKLVVAGFLVSLCVMNVACGSSGSSNPISQTDAQAFVGNLLSAGTTAYGNMPAPTSAVTPAAAVLKKVRAHVQAMPANANVKPLDSCSTTTGICIYNDTYNYATTCTGGGGSLETAETLTGDIYGFQGTANLTWAMTISATDWTCDGPAIQTDPGGVQINMTFNDTTAGELYPLDMTFSGGFSSGAQDCTLNVQVYAESNGSGNMSGTVCGYSVNSTF